MYQLQANNKGRLMKHISPFKKYYYSFIFLIFFVCNFWTAQAHDNKYWQDTLVSYQHEGIILDEFTINDDFKEFIKEYVERTSDAGNEEILSIALRNCYTKIIEIIL